MKDNAYSLDILPSSLRKPTFPEINAIEANLKYLMLLFPYFSGSIRAAVLGSYGYLELTETAKVGDGFLIESAIRIDKITVTVTGANLNALTFEGSGWFSESRSAGSLILAYTSDDFMIAAQIQHTLNTLRFGSSDDLDSTITLQVSNTAAGVCAPVGPVSMIFRGGVTWLLVECKKLKWKDVDTANMTWEDFEKVKK